MSVYVDGSHGSVGPAPRALAQGDHEAGSETAPTVDDAERDPPADIRSGTLTADLTEAWATRAAGGLHGRGIRRARPGHGDGLPTDQVSPIQPESPGYQAADAAPLVERCAAHLPADAVSIAEVTGWRDAHAHIASHVARWNRVLTALGQDTGTDADAHDQRGIGGERGALHAQPLVAGDGDA